MDAVREVTKRLLRDGIEPEELEAARATYTTSFYLESDGAYRQAITLGDWQLTSGDRELITSHLAAIDAVSAQDARAALAAALPGLRFGAAGPDADAEAAALLGAEGGDECVLACQCRNGDPGVEESCNGSDDDCDGRIDEGTLNACDACGATPGEQCDGVDNDCDGQIDESLSKNACGHCGPVTALNCPQHHTVFVSSVVFAATFGSIENADRECQQLAEKAGRAGTWRALLADDQHPLSLQVPITAPVFNTRDELVAESGSDFFFSRTQKPIDTSESGKRLQDTLAWVGSQTEHCARWTSGSREVTGAQSSSTSGYWLVDARPGPCDTRHSLYCVDQF
jgi:hypothetical protein